MRMERIFHVQSLKLVLVWLPKSEPKNKMAIQPYSLVSMTRQRNVPQRLNKGTLKKAGTSPKKKVVEFRDFEGDYQMGDQINVELFTEGEFVDVAGTSKGKGFQGVVKRHGFAGVGQATHGQHNRLRAPGSIGAASYPARVFKGMRMAGRMGGERVTVQNLQVVKVIADKNLLVVKGCVPGHKNAYVIVEK